MIDSHCHLTDDAFRGDRSEVLARARSAGVSPMIVIADSLEESKKVLSLAENHDDILCAVGLHPHYASQWKRGDAEIIRDLARSPNVAAIGETGLDYHYMRSPKERQIHAFRDQLNLAQSLHMPVVIHTRDAIEDTWSILDSVKPIRAVIHCCTEPWSAIERFVEYGCFLSFTGIATYPKSEDIRETIRRCPLSRIMIETDAPYLSPIPHRGKRNEPSFVVEVARCIAEVKNESLEEVDIQTTKNAKEFYGIA